MRDCSITLWNSEELIDQSILRTSFKPIVASENPSPSLLGSTRAAVSNGLPLMEFDMFVDQSFD